nr:hypothetical protein [Paraburkholderia tropica]
MVGVVARAANTDSRYVWVYLAELPAAQMVEYGKLLPSPGGELAWLESMSQEDRDYLTSVGR